MRIVAGKYRGKNLYSPKTGVVRPTSDRAREALFNILFSKFSPDWENCRFLDVFAGTGAVGFEALSRGAAEVAFIDINIQNLSKNIELFPAEKEKIRVYKQNAENLSKAVRKYNMIYLDAPYNKGLTQKALTALFVGGWVEEGTLIVAETEKGEELSAPTGFELVDERIYGPAKLWFFTHK